jgi:hypothetical protein
MGPVRQEDGESHVALAGLAPVAQLKKMTNFNKRGQLWKRATLTKTRPRHLVA